MWSGLKSCLITPLEFINELNADLIISLISTLKHVSVGGGLLGAMVGGKTGAIIGGSVLGKSSMSGTVERHSFPVCCHLGVEVTINGLIHEIVLCNHEIDLDSQKYYKVYESANTLIEMIRDLAKTPVPTDFVKETEDPSVLALKDESEKLKKQLDDLKENRPEFVLPDTFRLEEQKDLSVDDYLDYLKEQDKNFCHFNANYFSSNMAYYQKTRNKDSLLGSAFSIFCPICRWRFNIKLMTF